MREPATLRDVAERAGVSVSLASLALRGDPRVSDHRRAAILAAAEELDYRPHAAARQLRRRRSQVLGVLVSDLANPFHTDIAEGVEIAAEEAGYRVVLANGRRDAGRLRALTTDLIELRVEGIVMVSTRLEEAELERVGRAVPTVVVGRPGIAAEQVGSVTGNDRHGATIAVEHLLELGHRDIAHLMGGDSPAQRARQAGFLERVRRHADASEPRLLRGDTTEEGGIRGAEELLARADRPTAVFCANDLAALGLRTRLADAGVRVPQDLSVVGYDDTWLAGMHHVALTTVHQPRRHMGELAVRLLLSQLQGSADAEEVVLEPELRVRSSTGPPPPR